MKIGTRMPPFSHQIGFDAYAAWLADNGFGAVDTPPLTRQIARTCERLGLAIGSSDGGGQVLSPRRSQTPQGLGRDQKELERDCPTRRSHALYRARPRRPQHVQSRDL